MELRTVEVFFLQISGSGKAVLVSKERNGKEVWIPISQIEEKAFTWIGNGPMEITCPVWLLEKKGLISTPKRTGPFIKRGKHGNG